MPHELAEADRSCRGLSGRRHRQNARLGLPGKLARHAMNDTSSTSEVKAATIASGTRRGRRRGFKPGVRFGALSPLPSPSPHRQSLHRSIEPALTFDGRAAGESHSLASIDQPIRPWFHSGLVPGSEIHPW